MKPAIHDRGRGPEIVGSRITVYDVLAETRAGVPVEQLACEWKLSVEQIEVALQYIQDHREEVERDWAEIRARHSRQRTEQEAKYGHLYAAASEKLAVAKAEFDRKRAERLQHARDTNGYQHPGSNGESATDLEGTGVE